MRVLEGSVPASKSMHAASTAASLVTVGLIAWQLNGLHRFSSFAKPEGLIYGWRVHAAGTSQHQGTSVHYTPEAPQPVAIIWIPWLCGGRTQFATLSTKNSYSKAFQYKFTQEFDFSSSLPKANFAATGAP